MRDPFGLDVAEDNPVNVPNALSAARIALVPVLIWVLFAETPYDGSALAATLFAIASITDVIDGHLARSKGLVTEVGKVLDPLADKLMVSSVLISLAVLGQMPAWAVVVILGREVAVSIVRSRASKRGQVEVGARALGKLKMGLQVLLVLVLLVAPDPSAGPVLALLYVTVAVTVVSGLDAALAMRPRSSRWSNAAS
jgi:CDP-diacylglycerol---glycerol-3-phosphate 3-phosphatidyltransferase